MTQGRKTASMGAIRISSTPFEYHSLDDVPRDLHTD
jgi:hypothetical protein